MDEVLGKISTNNKTSCAPKVLITGASSGIGQAVARLFARGGYEVYGTSRSIKKESKKGKNGERYRSFPMDVTSDDSVKAAAEKIGYVDILILAAGFGIAGSAEEVPIELVKKQMEVNYYGVLRVVSAFLPAMRERRSGKIIIIGSVGGRVAIPMQSHYSSGKYALEAYSDALRLELKPFGIDVTIVEPGDTKTDFTVKRETYIPKGSPYEETARHAIGVMEHDEQSGSAPDSVAKAVLKVAKSDNPKARVAVGLKYKALCLLLKFLPDRIRLMFVRKIYLGTVLVK